MRCAFFSSSLVLYLVTRRKNNAKCAREEKAFNGLGTKSTGYSPQSLMQRSCNQSSHTTHCKAAKCIRGSNVSFRKMAGKWRMTCNFAPFTASPERQKHVECFGCFKSLSRWPSLYVPVPKQNQITVPKQNQITHSSPTTQNYTVKSQGYSVTLQGKHTRATHIPQRDAQCRRTCGR